MRRCRSAPSVESLYVIAGQSLVGGHDDRCFELRLSDQHPFEWVPMVRRQRRRRLSMRSHDRQRNETRRLELVDQPPGHRQLPTRTFDPQLPRRHRRDEGLVSVRNQFTTMRTHRGTVIEPPQRNVTIQKDPHNTSASEDSSKIATTSGSGPTRSSPYATRPDHDPGTRAELAAFHATILATGRPIRATITSAPPDADRTLLAALAAALFDLTTALRSSRW